MILHNKQSNGFALLMSLIVVSVVVSIGLVVLDLTLKQLRLSTNSKDSETAFHAANAAMECARYIRNEKSADFVAGNNLTDVECFGVRINNVTADPVPVEDVWGDAFLYSFESNNPGVFGFSWGTPSESERCSQIDIMVLNSEINQVTTVEDMPDKIQGYPEPEKVCDEGGLCTVIAARGYSRYCDEVTLPGTVEREVLLEL